MKKTIFLFLLINLMAVSGQAQKLTQDMIGDFMLNGSLTIRTIRNDTIREIAHSIEFPKFLMGWMPGKNFSDPINGSFQLTSGYILTSDEKSHYIVLMVPGNMQNMNIRVDKIENGILKGEVLIPEFMFYDPKNPPKMPHPTYVHISKEASRLKHFFYKDKLVGTNWEIIKTEGCQFDMPFVFILQDGGEAQAKWKGQDSFLSWDVSSAGGYIFLEPGDFSERIVGIRTDEHTINAYSDLTLCRLTIKRKK